MFPVILARKPLTSLTRCLNISPNCPYLRRYQGRFLAPSLGVELPPNPAPATLKGAGDVGILAEEEPGKETRLKGGSKVGYLQDTWGVGVKQGCACKKMLLFLQYTYTKLQLIIEL